MTTMRAVRIHAYGGPDVLKYEDAPRPEPAPGEVLVRVHAASVNPFDWKVRAGYLSAFVPYQFPLILGWDISGVVEAVADDVTDLAVGDAVFGRPDVMRGGGYAEYVAVRATELVRKPATLDHRQAAATPQAALSAWRCLFDAAQLSAGQTVLIHGAAGGVGIFAVQLAKWRGARVIGTASAENRDFLLKLGADEVIDYNTTRFEDVVHDVDVVLDTIGGDTLQRSWGVLKPGGILVSLVEPPSAETAAAHGVRAAMAQATSDPATLSAISDLIGSGRIKPVVSVVFPLHRAAEAHALSEGMHVRGKIVLDVVGRT